jgi:hypothetical protein
MSNRAVGNRTAIEQSASTQREASQRRTGRSSGWCSDYERELQNFLSGAHVSAAGLHSSLGQQLARMRDGLGPSEWSAQDIPPELRGADKRAEEVGAALMRTGEYEAVLRAQYQDEPAGRLTGFECLLGTEHWSSQGADLTVRTKSGERVMPVVVMMAMANDLARKGKAPRGFRAPRDGEPPSVWARATLRVVCQTAMRVAPPGEARPSKDAVSAARDSLSTVGTRAKRLLDLAQVAYARARAGAAADEVRRFIAELDEGAA